MFASTRTTTLFLILAILAHTPQIAYAARNGRGRNQPARIYYEDVSTDLDLDDPLQRPKLQWPPPQLQRPVSESSLRAAAGLSDDADHAYADDFMAEERRQHLESERKRHEKERKRQARERERELEAQRKLLEPPRKPKQEWEEWLHEKIEILDREGPEEDDLDEGIKKQKKKTKMVAAEMQPAPVQQQQQQAKQNGAAAVNVPNGVLSPEDLEARILASQRRAQQAHRPQQILPPPPSPPLTEDELAAQAVEQARARARARQRAKALAAAAQAKDKLKAESGFADAAGDVRQSGQQQAAHQQAGPALNKNGGVGASDKVDIQVDPVYSRLAAKAAQAQAELQAHLRQQQQRQGSVEGQAAGAQAIAKAKAAQQVAIDAQARSRQQQQQHDAEERERTRFVAGGGGIEAERLAQAEHAAAMQRQRQRVARERELAIKREQQKEKARLREVQQQARAAAAPAGQIHKQPVRVQPAQPLANNVIERLPQQHQRNIVSDAGAGSGGSEYGIVGHVNHHSNRDGLIGATAEGRSSGHVRWQNEVIDDGRQNQRRRGDRRSRSRQQRNNRVAGAGRSEPVGVPWEIPPQPQRAARHQ